jgi:hypothetical protein
MWQRALVCACVLSFITAARAQQPPATAPSEKPVVDIVFCIDCSGSMGGVIETAKQKVWTIVNEVARVKPTPVLRIGLYGYGNGEGPFRVFPLTDDLDEIYKNLMTFKDEGWGSEFVGLVVQRATDDMKWAEGKQVLKLIYVVGNETAQQGRVDYRQSAPAAIAKGIAINAIYCGTTDYASATPTWRELAKLADGEYMEIAGDGGAVVLATPFDDELAKLNGQLNATYIAYGGRGSAGVANQAAQDSNAMSVSAGNNAIIAERAAAKASPLYVNGRWDLVDRSKDAAFDIASLKEEELPQEMRNMSAEQRKQFVAAKAKEREAIQAQIRVLSDKRQQSIQEQMRQQGVSTDKALDEVVRRSVVEKAKLKGFQLSTPTPAPVPQP